MAATNRRRDVARRLASATCALLGAAPASAGLLHGWDVETAVLHYQEADDRVSAVEPVVSLKRAFSGNRALKLKLAVDVLTGSTPNGAVPSRTPQTYTTPSGASSYDTAPGETPLDDTFTDTRVAFIADWE